MTLALVKITPLTIGFLNYTLSQALKMKWSPMEIFEAEDGLRKPLGQKSQDPDCTV